jgi:hypothetical protein
MEVSKAQIDSILIYYASLRTLYGTTKGKPGQQRNISGAFNALEYALEVLGIDYTNGVKARAL